MKWRKLEYFAKFRDEKQIFKSLRMKNKLLWKFRNKNNIKKKNRSLSFSWAQQSLDISSQTKFLSWAEILHDCLLSQAKRKIKQKTFLIIQKWWPQVMDPDHLHFIRNGECPIKG